MNFPTPAQVKKLAAACRKCGITYFRCADFEFSLGDTPQPKVVKSDFIKNPPKKSIFSEPMSDDGWDTLSEEERLLWSVGGVPVEGAK